MKNYYLNKSVNSDGGHVVHRQGCEYVSMLANKINLGKHGSCRTAVRKAQQYYKRIDGCYYCCPNCYGK